MLFVDDRLYFLVKAGCDVAEVRETPFNEDSITPRDQASVLMEASGM